MRREAEEAEKSEQAEKGELTKRKESRERRTRVRRCRTDADPSGHGVRRYLARDPRPRGGEALAELVEKGTPETIAE